MGLAKPKLRASEVDESLMRAICSDQIGSSNKRPFPNVKNASKNVKHAQPEWNQRDSILLVEH